MEKNVKRSCAAVGQNVCVHKKMADCSSE